MIHLAQIIEQGLHFLESRQLPSGRWQIWVSSRSDLTHSQPREDVFTTAFILRETAPLELAEPVKQKACQFLIPEQRENGLWRFYKRGDLRLLPLDFDTTSCTAAALLLAGHPLEVAPILEQLNLYRHPNGGYWTYAMPPKAPESNWLYPIAENIADEYVINAHILYFLVVSHSPYTEQLTYLNEILHSRAYAKPQVFYDSPLLFLYNLAKTLPYLPPDQAQPLGAQIRQHTHDYLDKTAANDLQTAYALATLVYTDDDSEQLNQLAAYLRETQQADGGWNNFYFHCNPIHYYGSREVVTAIVLHALSQLHRRQSI